ncbi:hypothetical protein H2248_004903 [Termitomyces sp. 'cryptogamus']|nr:hypothetical protein H2248_004903 [Termitomyces sp. 'cryptogamus']
MVLEVQEIQGKASKLARGPSELAREASELAEIGAGRGRKFGGASGVSVGVGGLMDDVRGFRGRVVTITSIIPITGAGLAISGLANPPVSQPVPWTPTHCLQPSHSPRASPNTLPNFPNHHLPSVPTPANSDTSLANSNSPLANSDIFPTAANTSPGSSEPWDHPLPFLTLLHVINSPPWFLRPILKYHNNFGMAHIPN